MSFEDLRHSPDFDLPSTAPSAPSDVITLIDDHHEGLHKVQIHKMIRRGSYESIATIICSENPNKKTRPLASAEDIADYCMMTMQYEIDKSDDPGTYRVKVLGPPGKGKFEASKHVHLGGDGEATTKSMLSEGELIEQQSQYIGELHSQIVAMSETVHSMIKPLLQENKEMMKIVSDAAKKQAELEREKMRHELELRIHNDEIKLEQEKEEMKSERWRETMDAVKESGAIEGLGKAILRKLNNRDDEDDDDDDEEEEEEAKKPSPKNKVKRPVISKVKREDKESKLDKAKNRSGRPKFKKRKKGKDDETAKIRKKVKEKTGLSDETVDALEGGDEMSDSQMAEVFEKSALQRADENPLSVMCEILKMTIDEGDQWEIIEETLSADQLKLFKKILTCDKDKKIAKMCRKLYALKGARRFMKLEKHLTDQQQKYVEQLVEIGMK